LDGLLIPDVEHKVCMFNEEKDDNKKIKKIEEKN
jgi:hypothetical protein